MKTGRILAILAVSMMCGATALARPLVVGSISKNPAQESAVYQPVADYLARELKGSGITAGKVVVVRSIAEMTKVMKGGGVDVLFDSPYPTLAVAKAADAQIVLRRWKGGKSGYRSLIVVRADSPLRTPRDLAGKVIGFEDPYSTSGFFMPASALRKAGIALREVKDAKAAVAPDETGFMFSGKQANTLVWLQEGRVSAVGVGEHDFEKFQQDGAVQMRPLLQTASVPRHLVSVRKNLPPALTRGIVEALVGMEKSADGRRVLHAFEETTRFDEVPSDAETVLEAMKRLLAESEAPAKR